MEKPVDALERLHEEIRREQLEEQKNSDEEEWIRIQTTGGGAET
tara:strand:- start:313 stop:444 length:132 start_codon:yes stop_codon:yes gene_type:complete